jgi:hypothetical protein
LVSIEIRYAARITAKTKHAKYMGTIYLIPLFDMIYRGENRMTIQIKKDKQGTIITYPVTEMGVTPIGAIASLILILEYVETQEALEKEEYKQIQAILTAPMALELAEKLQTVATLLLAPQSSDTKIQ